MVGYTAGVLTGVYLGMSMAKEFRRREEKSIQNRRDPRNEN